MSRAADYREQALLCRQLAGAMSLDEHRDQLLRMAEGWEQLAKDANILFREPTATSRDDDEQKIRCDVR